jgi:hypothetical protein
MVYVDSVNLAKLPPKGVDEEQLTEWIKNKTEKSESTIAQWPSFLWWGNAVRTYSSGILFWNISHWLSLLTGFVSWIDSSLCLLVVTASPSTAIAHRCIAAARYFCSIVI